jgi:cytochrome oxidase Cu insertion factor (SCO1/SenC/PrrC family)
MIGTWKVYDVKTDFDERKTTPQMLEQYVEIQKQTHFKIVNDSVMAIISGKNTFEAFWIMNNSDVVFYHFKGDTTMHRLGEYKEPYIVSESKTKLGTIVTKYVKE